jgi:hypothetical protein
MIEREDDQAPDRQPDEVPTDEDLDVEGPNESTQPSEPDERGGRLRGEAEA